MKTKTLHPLTKAVLAASLPLRCSRCGVMWTTPDEAIAEQPISARGGLSCRACWNPAADGPCDPKVHFVDSADELFCEECPKAITTGVNTRTGVVCSDCSDEVLDPPLPPLTSAPAELACVRCGCTELVACDGGCSWACESVNICSACVPLHLVPLFDEIRRLEEMVESAAELLSGRVDAAHAILKGDGV